MLANPATIRGARFAPKAENGQIIGFRASAVRRNSLFSELGVRSGDVINSVNGMELSSPDKLLEIYGKVRDADRFSINVTRRGKPITMSYAIK